MADQTPLILVVDDEPELLSIVADFMLLFGHDVVTAGSGPEALQLAEEKKIDVLVTDLVMPAMTGIKLIEALRAKGHQFPAIVYSAYSPELETLKGWEDQLGVVAKIDKPFTEEELQAGIDAALGKEF